MIYPRTKVLERRREVVTLLVRGVPPGEIAEILHVSRQTIYNDIRYIRSNRNEALHAYSRREIIAQLYLNAQARTRYLWDLAETAESEHARVNAMRELRLNDERITNKLPPILTPAQMKEKEAIDAYMRSLFPGVPVKAGPANGNAQALSEKASQRAKRRAELKKMCDETCRHCDETIAIIDRRRAQKAAGRDCEEDEDEYEYDTNDRPGPVIFEVPSPTAESLLRAEEEDTEE